MNPRIRVAYAVDNLDQLTAQKRDQAIGIFCYRILFASEYAAGRIRSGQCDASKWPTPPGS